MKKFQEMILPFSDRIESIVKPINSREPSDEKSFTNQYQKHVPCGFSYKVVCFDDKIWPQDPVSYRSESEEDIGQIFVELLERDLRKIHEEFNFAKKLIFTKESKKEFEKAKNFRICGLSLKNTDGVVDKVRDHCHFTGKYRGAAHNLNYAIYNSRSQSSLQWFFIISQTMIVIFSSRISERAGIVLYKDVLFTW